MAHPRAPAAPGRAASTAAIVSVSGNRRSAILGLPSSPAPGSPRRRTHALRSSRAPCPHVDTAPDERVLPIGLWHHRDACTPGIGTPGEHALPSANRPRALRHAPCRSRHRPPVSGRQDWIRGRSDRAPAGLGEPRAGIERCFNRIKGFRGMATRYDKTAVLGVRRPAGPSRRRPQGGARRVGHTVPVRHPGVRAARSAQTASVETDPFLG
ncbi:hypothetical protein GCM10020295_08070 [Streptomyces cinereospinus]